MTGRVLAFSFPNPFELLISGNLSPVLFLGREAASYAVDDIIEGLAGAVIGAYVDLAAGIMGFFWTASEPELQSEWFYGSPEASYDQMVALAAPLLVAFFLAGVIQGVLRGDTTGMLRMALLRLPGAILAMSTAIVFADLLLDITDEMSVTLLAAFRDDVEQVGVMLRSASLQGSVPAMLLELVFAAVGLVAAVVVVLELFVRAALVYLVAAFSPLIYAASVWEPMRGAVRKLGEIALALILSKLAIAMALAVSSAALVAAWPGNTEPTEITTPEQIAEQWLQPFAQQVGVLVSAVVMFCIAAFMPFVLWRLLPVAEGAVVAQGVKGAPFRAAYMTSYFGSMARNNPATALMRGKSASGGAAAAGKGSGAVAATAANPAVGAAVAAATVATKGAKAAKNKTAAAAEHQSSAAGGSSGQARKDRGGSQPKGRPSGAGGQRPSGASGPSGGGTGAAKGSSSQRPQRPQQPPGTGRGQQGNNPSRRQGRGKP